MSLLLVACGGVAAGWSRLAWCLLHFYSASPSLSWRVGALYADVFNRSTAVGRLVGFGFFAGCRLNLFRGSRNGVVAFPWVGSVFSCVFGGVESLAGVPRRCGLAGLR